MQPLISVIVPIYNVEKYLNKCIESIVNQTYKNLEILLVDDGSSDNCPKICDDWAKKDERIKVIHKENGGVSSARNAGLDAAAGEYIGFVDSDDYIDSDMFEFLITDSKQNDTEISCCTFRYVNEEDNIVEKTTKPFISDTAYFTPNEMCRLFYEGNDDFVQLWNKVYKRRLFDNLRFPEGRVFEDWDLAPMLYFESKKSSYIPVEKYNYFLSEGSISRTYSLKRYCDCVLSDYDHYEFFNSKGVTDYNAAIAVYTKCDFFKCCRVYSAGKENKKMLRQAYKKAKISCKSKKISLFYYFRGFINILLKVKEKLKF